MLDTKRAALEWAARGFRVFPLSPNSKIPVKGMRFTEEATSTPAQIEAWWLDYPEANVGVLCDDMIVVDVDVKRGKQGVASFKVLGLPNDTLIVKTPSGGLHFYYRGPSKQNRVDLLGEGSGLDVRSYHGYVVAPGSVVAEGAYEIAKDLPLRDCPAEFVARLDDPAERQGPKPAVDLDKPEAVLRAVRYLREDARLAVQGAGGDMTTYLVACEVKDQGVSADVALQLMAEHWNERCSPPWDLNELKVKVTHAYGYGQKAAGAEAPEAAFHPPVLPQEAQAPAATGVPWIRHGDAWAGEVDWLFYRLMPRKGLGILTAPSQAGKTFVVTEWARCGATGKAFFGVEPEERFGTVMLFGGTEGSGLRLRLAALGETDPLPIAALNVPPLAAQEALFNLETNLRAMAEEMAAVHGVALRLVILETLSSSGLLRDENDNAEAARVLSMLDRLGRTLGVFVLVTHHPPKEGKGERGAGAIRNNVDYVYEIHRDGRAKLRDFELTKARDAEQRELGAFSLHPVVLGRDLKGRDVTSMVLNCSGAPSGAQGPREAPRNSELFAECLEWALIEKGVELANGRRGVDRDEVAAVFRERWKGSSHRSNQTRAFDTVYRWAQEVGLVDVVAEGAQRYLVPIKVSL